MILVSAAMAELLFYDEVISYQSTVDKFREVRRSYIELSYLARLKASLSYRGRILATTSQNINILKVANQRIIH